MICIFCKQELSEDNFYNDSSKKNGKKPRCKKCDLLSRDKNKRAEYEKLYWEKNKEVRKNIASRCYEKNKERYKEQRIKYLQTDKGIEMYKKQTQTRYALRKNAFVEKVNPMDVYAEQNGICYICNNKFNFKEMELDHVVPLAKGGLHQKTNCKMACTRCNRSKGAKMVEEVCHQVV